MTWNEFKEWVDNQLSAIGEDGNVEIAWIDICDGANMKHVEARIDHIDASGHLSHKKRLIID